MEGEICGGDGVVYGWGSEIKPEECGIEEVEGGALVVVGDAAVTIYLLYGGEHEGGVQIVGECCLDILDIGIDEVLAGDFIDPGVFWSERGIGAAPAVEAGLGGC